MASGNSASIHDACVLVEAQRSPIRYLLPPSYPAANYTISFYKSADWADSYVRLSSISACGANCAELGVDASTPPVYDLTPKCRVMGVDLIEELDAADESYVDTDAASLHFCPPGGAISAADPLFLTLGASAVVINPAASQSSTRANRIALVERPGRAAAPVVVPGRAAATAPIQYISFSAFTLAHSRSVGLDASNLAHAAISALTVVAHGATGVNFDSTVDSTLTNSTGVWCCGVVRCGAVWRGAEPNSATFEPTSGLAPKPSPHWQPSLTRTLAPNLQSRGTNAS